MSIEAARCCFRAVLLSTTNWSCPRLAPGTRRRKYLPRPSRPELFFNLLLLAGGKKLFHTNIHLFSHPPAMPTFTPTSARQALRIASRRYPSSTFSRTPARTAGIVRRHYVSETKPSNATVSVESAVKADQKAFFKETGNRPQDAVMPTTGLAADAMLSPTAGAYCNSPFSSWHSC